jgi:hypothetical protein
MPELIRVLGKPSSSGVGVGFRERDIPKHRYAKLIWQCDPERSTDGEAVCPSNCIAANLLPYSTVEFDPTKFPEDTWVLYACEKHADSFKSYPDATVPT